jgi:glycerol-3-phosphate dehydrogenase
MSVPGKRSSVFAVPWGDFTYIGTTDTDYEGDLDRTYCTAADVQYLLDSLNDSTTRNVGPADVLGTWAGLRPLLRDAKDAKTADLSRRHRVTRSESGVVTVGGGKLTTWRRMAEDTVDEVLQLLGRTAPCRTKALRLRGADGWAAVAAGPVSPDVRDHLAGRYGAEAAAVIQLIGDDPSLGEPLVPGLPYLRAEAVFAARAEMAMTVNDVLTRRTRARLFGRDASAEAADEVAELLGAELGWSPEERSAQVAAYRDEIALERAALELPASAPIASAQPREPGWVPGLRQPARAGR